MSKFKIAVIVIIALILGLFIFQNLSFFASKPTLHINLIYKSWETSMLPAAVIVVLFMFAGALITYFFTLADRFMSKQTIKSLTEACDLHLEKISALESQVHELQMKEPPRKPESGDLSQKE